MELTPIGLLHTPYKTTGDAPFQGMSSSETCEIEIFKEYEYVLKDIGQCSHLILLYWLDGVDDRVLQTHTPFDTDIHEVFATRAPNRPNPIGFHVAELIDRNENVLRIKGVDALDKTPLIGIKPYSSGIDVISGANIRWFEKVTEGDRINEDSYRKDIEELTKKETGEGFLERLGNCMDISAAIRHSESRRHTSPCVSLGLRTPTWKRLWRSSRPTTASARAFRW